MNDIRIKCPFCGSDKEWLEYDGFMLYMPYWFKRLWWRIIGAYVNCRFCGAKGPVINSYAGAVLAWNLRVK